VTDEATTPTPAPEPVVEPQVDETPTTDEGAES
jgi:hypothetical protein